MATTITSVGNVTNVPGKARIQCSTNGESTTFFNSGDFASMASIYNTYRPLKWDMILDEDDADVWNLTITVPWNTFTNGTDPSGEAPTIQWDLSYQTENKSILDLDNPVVSTVSDISAKVIIDAVKEGKDEILQNRLSYLLSHGTITTAEYNNAYYLYAHMKKGIKTQPVDVPILMKYAVASNAWVINWSQANRGKIYSTTRLLAEEPVDPRLVPTIQQFNDVYTPGGTSDKYVPLAYGWRKGSPKTTASNGNRCLITQTWTYGLYPTLLTGTPLT